VRVGSSIGWGWVVRGPLTWEWLTRVRGSVGMEPRSSSGRVEGGRTAAEEEVLDLCRIV